jgi:cystathionine gamma-synthase
VSERLRPETIAAQACHALDEPSRGIVPAIHIATTYARDREYQLASASYTRDDNPTPSHVEATVCALEGGSAARAFASGMAAATATIRALCRPGDHVVAPRVGYYGVRRWLAAFGARWDVAITFVDTSDLDAVRAALERPTRLVWIETPANPTWDVSDIAAVAALAHAAGARVVVDSTCATPVHTRPLTLGADFVFHSATKYLGGHSDLLAGIVVAARDDGDWQAICAMRHDEGACLGPFEAHLLLRGLRTLFVRVERASGSAMALAERLAATDLNVHVLYPGLASHRHHALAARQMSRGFGGMLSIRMGSRARCLAMIQRLRVWIPATSLGGVESLVEHRHTVEGPDTPTPDDLVRLSVGLEHIDDLYEDLVSAMS